MKEYPPDDSILRTAISPVAGAEHRPVWSVMIPTYNCAAYLRETLASVLAQDPGPDKMQIQVVDDCSTLDDPEAVVNELGRGRISFYRQPRNVGHTRNFDTCLLLSRGQLVHLLHGDDMVLDGFYRSMERVFDAHSDVGAAFCGQVIINEHGERLHVSAPVEPTSGILPNWLERIAVGQMLQTPAMVVRRAVYEAVGGFDHRIRYYGEDWEMWVRIAAAYPVWYQAEPLAAYRTHMTSLSGRSRRTGENMQDLRRAIEINRAHFQKQDGDTISKQALEATAHGALRRSRRMIAAGEIRAPIAQMREALICSHSPSVILETSSAFLFLLRRTLLRSIGFKQPITGVQAISRAFDKSSRVRT